MSEHSASGGAVPLLALCSKILGYLQSLLHELNVVAPDMQAGTAMSDLASAIGMAAEEATLVAELKAHSERAFALLIAQYSQPVYSMIARSLRDPADAADVTQEVFVKVFRHIESFHGDASLRTWIYRIALHEVSNQRRWWSRHKKQELTLDAQQENDDGDCFCLGDTLASNADSPLECAEHSEAREQVAAALRTIPEAFRSVVILREIEGFGYEEIAEMLNVNLGTVKSRLTRGRAALREALKSKALKKDAAVQSCACSRVVQEVSR